MPEQENVGEDEQGEEEADEELDEEFVPTQR